MSDRIIVKAEAILDAQLKQIEIEYAADLKKKLAPLEKVADGVTGIIRNGIEDYYKQAGQRPDSLIFGMWNIFAGIGSVGIMEEKQGDLSTADIDDRMIKPAGITDLDEFVIKNEGLDAGEMNGMALEAAKTGAKTYAKTFMTLPQEEKPAQIKEYEKACLLFGAAYKISVINNQG